MVLFKPMLAGAPKTAEEWASIRYPQLQSAKLDGFRTLTLAQGAVTRKLLPLANAYTRTALSDPQLEGLDGECLVADEVGSISDPLIYNRTQSQLATFSGEPNFVFMVFDCIKFPNEPFEDRLQRAEEIVRNYGDPRIRIVTHSLVESWAEVKSNTADFIEQGYEGSMLRDPKGVYKYGRSTVREQGLLKVKNFFLENNVVEEEAVIVRFEELESNRNLPEKNLLGRSKRSSHKENMLPLGTMGALWVKSPSYPEEFKIGSGFSEEQRQTIWNNQDYYIGKTVTFKHQVEGAFNKPRFPVFIRMRDCDDPVETFGSSKVDALIHKRKMILNSIIDQENLIVYGMHVDTALSTIELLKKQLNELIS